MPGSGLWTWRGGASLGRTRLNYGAEVGNGRGNSIVVACVAWMCRTFPESPIQVYTRAEEPALIPNHSMPELLRRPNPYYSGLVMWHGIIGDWMTNGNGYLWEMRSGRGRPVELWWLPSRTVEPRWPADGSQYISHYEYTPLSKPIEIPPSDIIHFRYGLDPDNTRKGLSPLASLLREIFTDDEAANYTGALLRNMGVPGVIITPEGDTRLDESSADNVKEVFKAKFSGDARGEPMVMHTPSKVSTLSFSPQQMSTRDIRQIPEERISAVLGIPAIVAGLGAGLARSTFSNTEAAQQAAYESNIIPMQKLFAADLDSQLLAEFSDPTKTETRFDNSGVRVLQPDQDALWNRARTAMTSGMATINEARKMVSLPPLPDGDVILLPINVVPTEPDALIAPEPEVPAALTTEPRVEDMPEETMPTEMPRRNGRAPAAVA